MASPHIDFALVEYLEHLWEEGDGLATGNYALAGLLHFIPALRPQLPGARRTLKGWRRLELPARACPITLDMALSVCGVFLLWGQPRLAYLTIIGFDLLLRTQEFTAMRLGMITLAADGQSAA